MVFFDRRRVIANRANKKITPEFASNKSEQALNKETI